MRPELQRPDAPVAWIPDLRSPEHSSGSLVRDTALKCVRTRRSRSAVAIIAWHLAAPSFRSASCGSGMNPRPDLGADPVARHLQVVGRLHTHPELGAGPEIAGKPQSSIGCDCALAVSSRRWLTARLLYFNLHGPNSKDLASRPDQDQSRTRNRVHTNFFRRCKMRGKNRQVEADQNACRGQDYPENEHQLHGYARS
jgi:hypothetical protein